MIGKVQGAGNSMFTVKYTYLDNNVYPNLIYYRLKQTDYNGDFTYSNIISHSNKSVEGLFIIKILNCTGQEVTDDYKGLKFFFYNNGSFVKKY